MSTFRPQLARTCNKVSKTAPVYCQTPVRNMSLFPRFVSHNHEITPLFRLLDDFATISRSSFPSGSSKVRAFAPKFDVRELKDAYELHGELPGVEQSNLDIQWEDAQTLSIKGRVESHTEQGTKPAGSVNEVEAETANDDKFVEVESSDYQKPTVEDEGTEGNATEGTQDTAVATADQTAQQVQPKLKDQPRYWLSERSVGEFQRTFSFPSRVDQDAVRASLKNGILSVVVPKSQPPKPRKITVE